MMIEHVIVDTARTEGTLLSHASSLHPEYQEDVSLANRSSCINDWIEHGCGRYLLMSKEAMDYCCID